MVVVIGADVHKATHTFVAVDEVGRKLAETTVKATAAGHHQVLQWAASRFGEAELKWGVEDCRNMSALLERDLLSGGAPVVRVPPKLMANTRSSARERGKSDPIDALAIARAVLREPELPVASHDQNTRELRLLTDRRDHLVAERTRQSNRLRWHLHEIDPEFDVASRALRSKTQRRRVQTWLAQHQGLVAELAQDVLADIDHTSTQILAVEKRIKPLVRSQYPTLLAIQGCAELTAAKIVGETANISRFRSSDCYAMNAGTAPLPVWSGNTRGKVRVNRTGNRQLNAALHRIALTQTRHDGLGRTYYQKKLKDKTKNESMRCLKRRLARVVFNALHTDQAAITTPQEANAA